MSSAYGFTAPRSERQQLAFLKREAESQKQKLAEAKAARERAAAKAAREAERRQRKADELAAKEKRKADRAAKAAARREEQAQKQARRLQREKEAAAQAKKGVAAKSAVQTQVRKEAKKSSGKGKGSSSSSGKPPSKAQLKTQIRKLIKKVDIKEVTSKGIRKMLETYFGCKLKPRKDEVKACLMAVLQEDQESSSEEEEEEDSSDEDKPKRKATGGFAMEYILSEQLTEIVGLEKATRGTISKQVWAYVKERDLQDPENKQYIMCDAKLKKLFEGTERIHGFSMSKFFGKHMTKP